MKKTFLDIIFHIHYNTTASRLEETASFIF